MLYFECNENELQILLAAKISRTIFPESSQFDTHLHQFLMSLRIIMHVHQ